MFKHAFLKNLKNLVKDPQLIFWMLFFPIVVSTLFFICFSNLDKEESFQKVPVAVVYDSENAAFAGAIASAGELFEAQEADAERAAELLAAGEVEAVLRVGEDVTLEVAESGIGQTIAKSFVDGYRAVAATLAGVIASGGTDVAAIYADLMSATSSVAENLSEGRNTNRTVIYYYALLGMVCFYFAMAGSNVVNLTQPNHSAQAQRVSVSPCPRPVLFAATMLAHIVVVLGILAVVLCYFAFVIGVDFGARVGFVILTGIFGALAGLGFGLIVGVLAGKREGVKTAVIVGLTMVLSVLAGLMSPDLKYTVLRSAPWMRFVNPLGLISDCFYALYYYQSLAPFWLYFGVLAGYAAVFFTASILLVGRKRYASI